MVGLIDLHVFGLVDDLGCVVSTCILKAQNRNSTSAAVWVAEAQLHLVQQRRRPDPKVLLQGQAADGQAPQHLFATHKPEFGDHCQQAAQHRKLVQQ